MIPDRKPDMHIEPLVPDFDYVKIRRTGGLLGVNQSLHVDRDLKARVSDLHAGDRAFDLDAYTSQELMAALATFIARNPGASDGRGWDLFHYDIELSAGGRVYHVNTVELGADEAIHGVMLAANRLIQQDPNPFHPMTMHTMAPA